MKKIKVSVIIPVYNTGKYVEEALSSIRNQSLSSIEIIIIDDGSTDNSYEVISSVAARDPRIQVYSQDNKGPSEARNKGLQLARGEYIYFMDSDDLLDENALLECYEKCCAGDLDFIFFDADVFGRSVVNLNLNYHRTHLIKDEVQSGISRLEYFFVHGGYHSSPCLNVIKRSYLERIKLKFYPGILHEDELFTFLLYIDAERVGLMRKAYFKRRLRDNSIMVSEFSRKNLDGYLTVLHELMDLKERRRDARIVGVVDRRVKDILNGILYNSRAMKIADRHRLFRNCIGRFIKYASAKEVLLLTFPVTRYIKKPAPDFERSR